MQIRGAQMSLFPQKFLLYGIHEIWNPSCEPLEKGVESPSSSEPCDQSKGKVVQAKRKTISVHNIRRHNITTVVTIQCSATTEILVHQGYKDVLLFILVLIVTFSSFGSFTHTLWCFSGEWQTRFDPLLTSKAVFYLDNKNSVSVDMMKSAQYPLRLLDAPELGAQVTVLSYNCYGFLQQRRAVWTPLVRGFQMTWSMKGKIAGKTHAQDK